jgi:hypothetical protein
MKWVEGISLVVVMLLFNIPTHAGAGWNAEEHDYHVDLCSNARQRAGANDAPNCQNYSSRTAYGCCCGTCDNYFTECREKTLPQDMCERISKLSTRLQRFRIEFFGQQMKKERPRGQSLGLFITILTELLLYDIGDRSVAVDKTNK